MKTIKIRLVGVSPLLMRNGMLADPLNQWSKAIAKISGKRKKTEEDHEEIGRLEFMGGMYLDKDLDPCLPGEVIESWIRTGARAHKRGKDVERGIFCDGNFKLQYKGPKDVEKLWEAGTFHDRRPVKVGQARVVRTRPMFNDWACDVEVNYDPRALNEEDIIKFCDEAAGRGVCDYRPRFGRCVVEVLK